MVNLDLTKQEIALIFGTLSHSLSTSTDRRQREPMEKIMTKLHDVHQEKSAQ
ncbi:MAG: hypothetical protein ACTSQA_00015 [Candidatus Heimdallarchaeaceae archaeon]